MKRFLSIFLVLIFLFNFTIISFSYADTIADLNEVGFDEISVSDTSGNSKLSEATNTQDDTSPKTDNLLKKILNSIQNLLSWLPTLIFAVIYAAPTVDGCIFNSQTYFKLSFFDQNPDGLVGEGLQGAIGSVYNAFRYLVTAVYIVVLVYLGLRMILSSVGKQKAHYKELFRHWLIGLLILFTFHWVMAGIIYLSNEFVAILAGVSSSSLNLAERIREVSFIDPGIFAFKDAAETSPITSFILYTISAGVPFTFKGEILFSTFVQVGLYVVLLGIGFVVMFAYLKRLFTIAILIILFPFVALSYVFDKIGDKKAQTLGNWFKEFSVNVMIQPLHALTLVLISILYSGGIGNYLSLYGPTVIGAIMSVLTLLLIPTTEKLLKQLFQISSNMGAGHGGFGRSLAQAGLAFRGAKDLGSAASKVAPTLKAAAAARRQTGTGGLKARWEAFNKASKETGLGKGIKDAIKLPNGNYKKYKDQLLEQTGSKSIAGARAKALAEVGAAAFGVGAAIGSSDSISGFASNAVRNAGIANETLEAGKRLKTSIWGDAKASKDYTQRIEDIKKAGDIDNLTASQKAKIKAELGIDLNKADLSTKEKKEAMTTRLLNEYGDLKRITQFGADAKSYKSKNTKAIENIENGMMHDGSGVLDKSKYIVSQDNKGTVYTHTDTGEQIFFNDKVNSKVSPGTVLQRNLSDIGTPLEESYINSYVDQDERVVEASENVARTLTTIKTATTNYENHSMEFANAQNNVEVQNHILSDYETELANVNQQLIDSPDDTKLQKRKVTLEREIQVQTKVVEEAIVTRNNYQAEVKSAETQLNKATNELRNNEQKLSNAQNAARKEIESSFATMDDIITDKYTARSSGGTVLDPATPPQQPNNEFSFVGVGASNLRYFLNVDATAREYDVEVFHDNFGGTPGVRIAGQEFEEINIITTSARTFKIINQNGKWYVK